MMLRHLLLLTALAPALVAAPSDEDLERALDAITVQKVKADLHFIASDEMGGRDSPSPGLRIAARFIRSRLVHLGWQPGARGGYFHEYTLKSYAMDEEGSFAEISMGGEDRRLALGSDYFLSPRSRGDRDLRGPLIFAGTFDEEELSETDLSGAWGVLRPGTRVSRKRLAAAAEAGLLGFVLPPDPQEEKTVAEIHGRLTELMRRPSMRRPRSYGVPMLYLDEKTSEVAFSGMDLAKVALGHRFDAELREAYRTVELEGATLENVCALWPGSDSELKNEVIILSAHYDHVGQGENGDIYNGADDNGSGTTGLLAIADALVEYGPMRRTVMLIWLSAEEKGLLGSAAWTRDPWLPEDMLPVCDINIDMIGRNAPDEIGITPTSEHPAYNRLTRIVEAKMGLEGFAKLNNADSYWSRSDQFNFSRNLEIPVAFLFSDVHEDYHKPTDTVEKIDYDKLSRVARLVVRMLDELQTDELDL